MPYWLLLSAHGCRGAYFSLIYRHGRLPGQPCMIHYVVSHSPTLHRSASQQTQLPLLLNPLHGPTSSVTTVDGMATFNSTNRYENVNLSDEGDWGSDGNNDSPPKYPPPPAPNTGGHTRRSHTGRQKYLAPNRPPGPGSNRGCTTPRDYVRYTSFPSLGLWGHIVTPVSYTHLTQPTNREV